MDSQLIFAELRNVLAYLYPDEASARRIVADAGLDTQKIEFSTHAINNWHAILNEAAKTNRNNQRFREPAAQAPEGRSSVAIGTVEAGICNANVVGRDANVYSN